MILTYDLINETFIEADKVMKSAFSTYVTPNFVSVKISKAQSYWMQIRKLPGENAWGLKVSNSFENYIDEERGKAQLFNSMLHELIHTLPGGMNHGYKFHTYCNILYSKTGNYVTTASSGGEGYVAAQRKINYKYAVVCPMCGGTVKYQRKCNATTYPWMYRCGRCGCDKLEVKKL